MEVQKEGTEANFSVSSLNRQMDGGKPTKMVKSWVWGDVCGLESQRFDLGQVKFELSVKPPCRVLEVRV